MPGHACMRETKRLQGERLSLPEARARRPFTSRPLPHQIGTQGRRATQSISTRAPFGKALTPTVVRAGYGAEKNVA
jgi:hypothetical protein